MAILHITDLYIDRIQESLTPSQLRIFSWIKARIGEDAAWSFCQLVLSQEAIATIHNTLEPLAESSPDLEYVVKVSKASGQTSVELSGSFKSFTERFPLTTKKLDDELDAIPEGHLAVN